MSPLDTFAQVVAGVVVVIAAVLELIVLGIVKLVRARFGRTRLTRPPNPV